MKRIGVDDDRAKLAFMRTNVHHVARSPKLAELASRIVRPYRPDDWRQQATQLFRFVRDGVRYQRDPDKREQLADPRATLWRGYDDCDGKASALVALLNAIGIDADVWPVWRGDQLVHVQAAVRWPGTEKLRNAHNGDEVIDGPEGLGWLVSDPTIRGAEIGANPALLPRNPDTGRLPLA